MIYTLTLNPALDYSVGVKNLKTGIINRTEFEKISFGGKGLNVSAVLNNLGVESIALGFVAGFTGGEIKRLFRQSGGREEFINLDNGCSRINIKIKGETETEINAAGPNIDKSATEMLKTRLDSLKSGDILVLSGSIPASFSNTLYADIIQRLRQKEVRIIVDASGDLMLNAAKCNPYLIKPNNYELGELFGVEIKTREDAAFYAMRLRDLGAVNVLVSLAGEGAVLVTENSVLISEAPVGTVINSVGAGDSMVAGFIAGILESGDIGHAFKMGVASGSAAAFSVNLPTKSRILEMYEKIKIE